MRDGATFFFCAINAMRHRKMVRIFSGSSASFGAEVVTRRVTMACALKKLRRNVSEHSNSSARSGFSFTHSALAWMRMAARLTDTCFCCV
jgi:hypothetical protein